MANTVFSASLLAAQYYNSSSRYADDFTAQGARWRNSASVQMVGVIGNLSIESVDWNTKDISAVTLNVTLMSICRTSKIRLYRSKKTTYENVAGTQYLDTSGGYIEVDLGGSSEGSYTKALDSTQIAWLQTQLRAGYKWFCLYWDGDVATANSNSDHFIRISAFAFQITYDARQYTVSYNKGANGSGTNTTATKTHGTNLTLLGAILSRTGYTQTGWATTDGGAKVYNLGDTYTANASVTLYPYWTINTYTVSFNGNGSGDAVSNVPANQTKTYGLALTLSSAIPTRKFYTFEEWNTRADGNGVSYPAGGTYNDNAALTLYAKWKRSSIVRMRINGTVYTGTIHGKKNGVIYNGIAYGCKGGNVYVNN